MAYTPQIEFYKKREFGDKLNMTFVFLRENAWPYLKIQMMITGPILLIINILMNQFSTGMLSIGEEISPTLITNMFGIFGMALISIVVTSSIMPAVTYGYMKAYQLKPPSEIRVQDVTKGLLSNIFNLLIYTILMVIVVFIGMMFLILPGIYLGVVLSLGASIIVFENNNLIDAFGRAFTLIKQKWWSTFGLILVITIIGYVINLVFALPRGALSIGEMFSSVKENGDLTGLSETALGNTPLNILFSVFETFGAILVYSLSFIVIAFQYFNLVERRESRGLMSRIASMDEETTAEDEETY